MENVLDNPAWNALISGNGELSYGDSEVRYFDNEVSPFVGFKENTADHFRLLYNLLPHNVPVVLIAPIAVEIPPAWELLQVRNGLQMVYDARDEQDNVRLEITALTAEHVPQMLALVKLTNPGPFGPRTIAFGHYCGIFDNDRLVAMAGQRLHAFDYMEISAVCTHPDYAGKGYAKQLLLHHIQRIKAIGGIPFLHVHDVNERAIQLYERLGFSARTKVSFYAMKKNPEIL